MFGGTEDTYAGRATDRYRPLRGVGIAKGIKKYKVQFSLNYLKG